MSADCSESNPPRPAPSGAVFLSYASQDSEAARRICETLRAAGIEVWFDQSELRGGDKWDQNIRRQIRECALFAPVISANTQMRGEGYFRLEWKLAADRSHLMARDQLFFLPVVVDDTPYDLARVPEEFHSVQWTRLPGGQTPAAFCERVRALLSVPPGTAFPIGSAPRPRGGPGGPSAPVYSGGHGGWPGPTPAPVGRPSRLRPALAVAGGAAVLAIALWQPWRPPAGTATPGDEPAVAAESETQRLVAKARDLFQSKDDAQRENFFLAEDLLKRAVALDVSDGEAWAAYGHLSADLYRFGFDRTPARLDALRKQTEWAFRLAPDSVEAQVTQASAADYLGIDPAKTEPMLRELVRKLPDNWQVLHALGRNRGRAGRVDEALELLRRAEELSGHNPGPMNDAASYLLSAGRYAEAEGVIAQSLARRLSGRALTWDIILKLCWRGDTAAAAAALEQWPPWFFLEDRGASLAGLVWLWRREYDKALAIYEKIPRDYVRDISFTGPRAALTAIAHALAGNREAARADWVLAIQAAERELAAAPGDSHALYWKAWAQGQLGQVQEAEDIRQQLKQRKWEPPSYYAPEAKLAGLALAVGQPQQALALLEQELQARAEPAGTFRNSYVSFQLTRAVLELNPILDPLRADPRFQELLPRAAAPGGERERVTGATPSRPVVSEQVAAPSPAVAAAKSVAVLAFKNLSDDKGSEYFSDGISEELANVLGRVPGLRVAGSTSAFSFKGRAVPVTEIARQLGVAHVVEGTVRRDGNRVRIAAKLINAADGFQVWASENFDREVKSLLAVQEEIAGLIAQALSLQLGAGAASSRREVNPEAYRLYLEGRQAWNLRTPAGYDRAEPLLERAVSLAPEFAPAHAALADVWTLRGEWADTLSPFGLRDGPLAQRIRAKVREALALDAGCAEAQASEGIIGWDTWRFDEAERALRQAIRLNPNYASAHQWLGRVLMSTGQLDEALERMGRAAAIDPLSARILDNYAWALANAGRPAHSLEQAERALSVQPGSLQARGLKAWALAELGRSAEALALARTLPIEVPLASIFRQIVFVRTGAVGAEAQPLEAIPPGGGLARVATLVGLGRSDDALSALDPYWLTATRVDLLLFNPVFDPLRGDARFARVLATIGLTEAHTRAQAWRAAHPAAGGRARE